MGSEIGEELEFYYFSGIAGQTWEYEVTDEADVVVKTADMVATGTIVGMYRGTYTPDAKGVWNFAIAAAKFGQSFHVGMGQEEVIQNIVEAGGTGDLAAILEDTGVTIPATIVALAALLTPEIADILAEVAGLNGDAMRGTDGAALVASGWNAALAAVLNNFNPARIGYLDELHPAAIPNDLSWLITNLAAVLGLADSAEAAGPFSYLDAGGEQDVYEDATILRRRVWLEVSNRNMTLAGTFIIYRKVDGANYDVWTTHAVTVEAGDDRAFDVEFTTNQHWKITYEESADEGAARAIPLNVIIQVIE